MEVPRAAQPMRPAAGRVRRVRRRAWAARPVAAVAVAVVVGLAMAPIATASAAPPGPPLDVPAATLAAALNCPNGFHHPEHDAVLLVHGTSVTADENWGWNYMVALPKAGFDACTVQMPDRALADMQASAEYVVYAIRAVAARAGRKVVTIGLSQGGLEPRWALRFWPDIRHLVSEYIAMATPNHGALFGNADCVSSCPPALWQQSIGSNYLTALNREETPDPGDVAYTSVYSLTDDIIQPAAGPNGPTAALAGASNIAVQDICPGRYVGHIQSAWDAAYYAVVIDALTHPGPAVGARVDRSYCNQQAMPGVDPVSGWEMTAQLYVKAGEVQSQYGDKPSSEPALRCYATTAGCPTTSAGGSSGVGGVVRPPEAAAELPSTSPSSAPLAPAGLLVIAGLLAARSVSRRRRVRQAPGLAMPTIGALSGLPPIEPANCAPDPKLKMPPSDATVQYP
jgi:triacylglycerol lipase